ncbi:MAG: DUF5671 domain-containing protein [Pseudoxanthomonas sp.]
MSSATHDLDLFVREALVKGEPKASLETALVAAGWPNEQIRSALDVYADVGFSVPVPRPRPYLSAREAFFYLTLFTTLYISTFHLGSLLFKLVEQAWPDPADGDYVIRGLGASMRWSIASLVIAVPVVLFMARHLGKELTRSPAKRLSAVRRWLTYLTLFIAAVVLIGDMITLVNNVLGGELSLRFVAKVVVVALIAGTVFGYYLWDLRKEEQEP